MAPALHAAGLRTLAPDQRAPLLADLATVPGVPQEGVPLVVRM